MNKGAYDLMASKELFGRMPKRKEESKKYLSWCPEVSNESKASIKTRASNGNIHVGMSINKEITISTISTENDFCR